MLDTWLQFQSKDDGEGRRRGREEGGGREGREKAGEVGSGGEYDTDIFFVCLLQTFTSHRA